ncbi:tetratricopeptide repeat protein [Vampirovibrio sp.]|uniref:tetratricopeptide repeat protein n=1 Tax=Vampirovibrio sp. TaxID=2717857 RepID=UPI003593FD79
MRTESKSSIIQPVFRKLAPWAALFSVFPAIVVVNLLFLNLFPAHSGSAQPVFGLKEALNPQNIQPQSLYIYNSRDTNRLFGNFYYTLGTQLAARGQISSAEGMLSKAAQLMPDNPFVHMNYGIVLEALQKNNEALAQYQEALKLNPEMSQALYSIGLLQDKMGQIDAGVASLKKALVLEPENSFINYDLGVLYAKKGDYPNSALYSKKALEGVGSDFAEAYNNYGYALAQMGQYAEALVAVDESLKLKPDSAATLDSKGFALYGLARYQEALAAYNEALKLDPTIGEVYLHLAQTQEKLKNYEQAIKAYETYLQLSPEATDKAQVQAKILEVKKKWPRQTLPQKPVQ